MMTKPGIITGYQRMIYSSLAVKRNFNFQLPTRCFSTEKTHPASTNTKEPKPDQPKVEREEKVFDMTSSGEIVERPKIKNPEVTTRPLNFEEARELAIKAMGQQKKYFDDKLESLKVIFGGQPDTPRTPDEEWYYKRVSFWMKRYENFVGLTEVKAAQARVVECERKFIETQEMRRELQLKIADIQKRIKDIHLELEKTHRGEDRYLVLVTQEHQVLKEERNLQDEFKFHEKSEREYFSALSNAVRDSHEKERAQAEKTKYWSVLGSIIGTCIGIFGTTINNRMRMNELRRLVSQNSSVEEIQAIGSELKEDFSGHRTSLAALVTEVQEVVEKAGSSLQNLDKMEELFDILKNSSDKIDTRVLERTMEQVTLQQNLLTKVITEHREQLDSKLEELQGDIFVQNNNVGQLTHITLKDREKDLKVAEKREIDWRCKVDSLTKQNESLKELVNANTKGIDEKMKDVRSLLLAQTQVPRFAEKWTEKIEIHEKHLLSIIKDGFDDVNKKLNEAAQARSQALAAINRNINQEEQHPNSELQLLELDTVNILLGSHQKKTQQALIMSVLGVGILAPIVFFSISKLI